MSPPDLAGQSCHASLHGTLEEVQGFWIKFLCGAVMAYTRRTTVPEDKPTCKSWRTTYIFLYPMLKHRILHYPERNQSFSLVRFSLFHILAWFLFHFTVAAAVAGHLPSSWRATAPMFPKTPFYSRAKINKKWNLPFDSFVCISSPLCFPRKNERILEYEIIYSRTV